MLLELNALKPNRDIYKVYSGNSNNWGHFQTRLHFHHDTDFFDKAFMVNVASLKIEDYTMLNERTSLERIDGKTELSINSMKIFTSTFIEQLSKCLNFRKQRFSLYRGVILMGKFLTFMKFEPFFKSTVLV